MKIDALVYPGIFEAEYQVTIHAENREVHLNVSTDFVEVEGHLSEEGAPGFLKVDIVDEIDEDAFLVALPGEPQGVSARVILAKDKLRPES